MNHMPVKYVNIEGPEFDLDYSYFLVHMCNEMKQIEQGIPLLPVSVA
jgi:hypothetical protein